MPKKKAPESQSDQSERFRNAVRDMVAAGELNPIEADIRLDRLTTSLLRSESTKRG